MTATSPGPDAAPHRQRGSAGPSTLTPAEAIRRLVSEKPEMNSRVQDWPEYARPASSVCTQQMVLSPIHIGGTNFTFYRYPELGTLLAPAQQEDMRVYANIGIADNPEFWSQDRSDRVCRRGSPPADRAVD